MSLRLPVQPYKRSGRWPVFPAAVYTTKHGALGALGVERNAGARIVARGIHAE